MTIVDTRIFNPINGGRVPARGSLAWRPTRRRNVDDVVITTKPFTVELAAGEGLINVDPSGVDWAWEVTEDLLGSPVRTITVAVPAEGPVAYTNLVQLDPATLDPAAEPVAAWWAMADRTIVAATVDDGGHLVVTEHGGAVRDLGIVKGDPGSAATVTPEAVEEALPERLTEPGIAATIAEAIGPPIVEDPDNPGFYDIAPNSTITEDPANPGFYLIGN